MCEPAGQKKPRGQGTQAAADAAPEPGLKVPAAQGSGSEAGQYAPGGHSTQKEVPFIASGDM